jgi:hypothetical protein
MNTHSKSRLHLSIAALCVFLPMALLMPSRANAQVYVPGGRLTLISNTPVMSADVSAATTVYYTAYTGNNVPIANGTTLQNSSFASELTLNLDSALQSGNIYDIFLVNNSGTLTLCTGPAWSTAASRGTGAESTQLTVLKGLSVNAVAIGNCLNGSTSLSVAAECGFYLGSVYMTGNGETSMQLKPPAAAGGTNNVLGLWNAYNRVRITAFSRDNTSNWTYGTASWRAADNSTNNKIFFLDGLQQSSVTGDYSVMAVGTIDTVGTFVGLNVDSSTTAPNKVSMQASAPGETSASQPSVTETFYPLLGLHYIQAVEFANAPNGNSNCCADFFGLNSNQQMMALTVSLEM